MPRATLFNLNKSQAVRLPKAVAFPDDVHEVEIVVAGRSRIIIPVGQRWTDYFAEGPFATEDFGRARAEEPAQDREPL